MKNRIFPPGLEEREAGIFRKLTWLYKAYMLARDSSTVKCEMPWGQDTLDQYPHFSTGFSGTCSSPGIVHFNKYSL